MKWGHACSDDVEGHSWPSCSITYRCHVETGHCQIGINHELKRQNAARAERLAKRRQIIEQNELNMKSAETCTDSDDSESARIKKAEISERVRFLRKRNMRMQRQRKEAKEKKSNRMKELNLIRAAYRRNYKMSQLTIIAEPSKLSKSKSSSQPLLRSERLQKHNPSDLPQQDASKRYHKRTFYSRNRVSPSRWSSFLQMSRGHRALENNRNEELKRQNAARSERLAKRRAILEQKELDMESERKKIAVKTRERNRILQEAQKIGIVLPDFEAKSNRTVSSCSDSNDSESIQCKKAALVKRLREGKLRKKQRKQDRKNELAKLRRERRLAATGIKRNFDSSNVVSMKESTSIYSTSSNQTLRRSKRLQQSKEGIE